MSAGSGGEVAVEEEGMLCISVGGGVDGFEPMAGMGSDSIIERSFIANVIGSTCSSVGADSLGVVDV